MNKKLRILLGVGPLLTGLVLTGCGEDNVAADAGLQSTIDGAATSPDATEVDSLPDLTGSWALREKAATLAALPIVGVVNSSTYSIRLVEMTPESTGYQSLETLCSIEFGMGTNLATNRFSDDYLATREPTTYSITVEEPASMTRAGNLLVEGAILEDPVNDDLPLEENDPRVIDEDGDGKPGFTINVEVFGLGEAEIYAVQRSSFVFSGLIESADRITGPVDLEQFESNIIGSTNELFEPSEPPTPDSLNSNFIMVRLADGSTCTDILSANEESLFGPR